MAFKSIKVVVLVLASPARLARPRHDSDTAPLSTRGTRRHALFFTLHPRPFHSTRPHKSHGRRWPTTISLATGQYWTTLIQAMMSISVICLLSPLTNARGASARKLDSLLSVFFLAAAAAAAAAATTTTTTTTTASRTTPSVVSSFALAQHKAARTKTTTQIRLTSLPRPLRHWKLLTKEKQATIV